MKPYRVILVILFLVGLISACSTPPNQKELVEKYTNEHSKFLPLNEMNIHYREEGEGEVIVLLHGTASSLHAWDKWTEALKKNYRVVRVDLPGFGLTGPHPNDLYEIDSDIQFINAFMQKLGYKTFHLVGSSLGGRIAWEYSLKHPKQVSSITLINALGYPQENWPPAIEMAQWPVMDTLVANLSPRFMFSVGLKEIYFDEEMVDDQLIDRYYELAHYPGNMGAFPKRVKAKLDTESSIIKNVSVPTLILWGEEDLFFPVSRAFDFGKDITHATVQTYPNVGHLPMEEVPSKSVNDFKMFLNSIKSDNLN